jgi:ribosomal protein S18 acetylase RimI-like enzyme
MAYPERGSSVESDAGAPAHSLRAATHRDAAFIYGLRVAGLREYVAQTWGWDDAVQAARFRAHFDPARYQVIVADGLNVGALAVEWRAGEVFLADIEVVPAWRGRGLGTAIVGAVLAEARRRRLPAALQVLKGNPARRLYERLGFRIVGETPTHYLMRTAGREPIEASAP